MYDPMWRRRREGREERTLSHGRETDHAPPYRCLFIGVGAQHPSTDGPAEIHGGSEEPPAGTVGGRCFPACSPPRDGILWLRDGVPVGGNSIGRFATSRFRSSEDEEFLARRIGLRGDDRGTRTGTGGPFDWLLSSSDTSTKRYRLPG